MNEDGADEMFGMIFREYPTRKDVMDLSFDDLLWLRKNYPRTAGYVYLEMARMDMENGMLERALQACQLALRYLPGDVDVLELRYQAKGSWR